MMTSTSESINAVCTARPDYLGTCPMCNYGLVDAPNPSGNVPLYEARRAQWNAGLLTLCTCQSGMARLKSFQGQHFSQAETLERQRTEAAAKRQAALFDGAGIPPKFLGYTVNGFVKLAGKDSGKQTGINAVKEFWRLGYTPTVSGKIPGLLMFGPPDTGKTGLLSPLFVQMVRHGKTGLWVQYNGLMAALKDFNSGKVDERVEQCQNVDILFIDDFGDPASDRAATDYTRDCMFRIIDHRHGRNMATFITTNLDLDKLTGQFHERLTRRLMEICVPVQMGGRKMSEYTRLNATNHNKGAIR